ncbi:MAG: 4Fe-4S dicluster domain-containing protein [Pirellulales bacterium]|nr:4Fe-4S dicluster domain-containing protein [Pirellulales bacterium]
MISKSNESGTSSFLEEVIEDTPGGERIVHCLQCGSCGGSCPNGADMQYTPRTLFAMINANQREAVLSANTMWMCVSCYLCTTRCPQNIPITDIMYALKRKAIAEKLAKGTDAPALAKTFTDLLDKYGRSFELGLASRYYLLNRPVAMLKMGPMGLSMFTRGRMSLLPTKIKNLEQLRAIIHKARELGDAS